MTDLLTPDFLAGAFGEDPAWIEEVLAHATPAELAELDALLLDVSPGEIELLPHQIPPKGLWRVWLLLAGRGAGKTQACAAYMNDHALGPPCSNRVPGGHRMGIIAPTQGDAVSACYEGPSGLRALNPAVRLRGGVEGKTLHWPGGATARLFGVQSPDDVERLRAGGNRCLDWLEELAAWRHLGKGLDQMRFGLRLGPNPRAIGSTTPKNRPEIKTLVAESTDPAKRTVISTATTYDNPHLPEDIRTAYRERYENTRLGAQELLGQVIGDLGDVFKASWFGIIVPESPAPENPGGSGWKRVRYWDMAATEGPEDPGQHDPENDPDWTAGAKVAWHRESRILVIEDIRRYRRTPAGAQAMIVQTASADGRGCPIRMEQEPGASGVTMIATYRQVLTGWSFDGYRPTGDKVTRAETWSTLAEQGRVILVDGPWIPRFVDEAEEFTRNDTHAHDDQIDAVSGAYAFLVSSLGRGGLRA